jgi:hypothetical protein
MNFKKKNNLIYLYMSDFQLKYLKYKKKYLDLKTEYEGGKACTQIVGCELVNFNKGSRPPEGYPPVFILYDNTDPNLKFLQDIKNKYEEEFLKKDGPKNDGYKTSIENFDEKLNGVLNVYYYVQGSKQIKSFGGLLSGYMKKPKEGPPDVKVYFKPIEILMNYYKEKMSFNIDKSYIISKINCNSTISQVKYLMKFLNDKKNDQAQVDLLKDKIMKPLLELVRLVQTYETIAENKKMKKRIGEYIGKDENLPIPSACDPNVVKISPNPEAPKDEEPKEDESGEEGKGKKPKAKPKSLKEKQNESLKKFSSAPQANTYIPLTLFNALNISEFKLKDVNDAIFIRPLKYDNGKLEIQVLDYLKGIAPEGAGAATEEK